MSNENSGSHTMLTWAIRELLGALPANRDWLNPDAERELRAFLATPAQPIAPAADDDPYGWVIPNSYKDAFTFGRRNPYSDKSGAIPLYTRAAAPVSAPTKRDAADEWQRLALQFDGHRMAALSHLRLMTEDPAAHRAVAAEFLRAPPLSGEAVLAERIAALAAPVSGPTVNVYADILSKLLRGIPGVPRLTHEPLEAWAFRVITHLDSRARSENSRAKVLSDALWHARAMLIKLKGPLESIAACSSALASTPPKADNE